MFRKENGVTLVALVITIIVLLILAGVTISMVLGDEGIIAQASDATLAQVRGDVTDAVNLALAAMRTEDVAIAAGVSDLAPATQTSYKAATADDAEITYTRLETLLVAAGLDADVSGSTVEIDIENNNRVDKVIVSVDGYYGTNYTASYEMKLGTDVVLTY